MSHHHQLQLQRFELKYIVSPQTALQVRQFVQSYLELDEYGADKPDGSYAIHSLYLDSDRLSFFWHTINGNKNRFKLRLRFYNADPHAPVFFEIKRREADIIRKQRAAVRRDVAASLLVGQLPHADDLWKPDAKSLACLHEFCQLMQQFEARPTARVSYLREAWVSPESDDLRVTIDRQVRCWPQTTEELRTETPDVPLVFGEKPVVEIKFTCRYPDWLRDMVHALGMTRGSAAKYVDGIQVFGQTHFVRQPGGFTERRHPHERMDALHR